MSQYVDGFILPIPRSNVDAYRRIAGEAGKLWREHGARDYKECIAEDVAEGKITDFPRSVKAEGDETVVFAWITCESRADRDRVNAAVMEDERMKKMMEDSEPVFDAGRMVYGGFEVIVDA